MTAAAPVLLLGIGLLASFPTSGWLVARAAGVHTLLEPALAAVLALVVTLVGLGVAAPFTVVFALALSPIAWVLSCAGRVDRARLKGRRDGSVSCQALACAFSRAPFSGGFCSARCSWSRSSAFGLSRANSRARGAREAVRAPRAARPEAGRRRRAASAPDGRPRDGQARLPVDERSDFPRALRAGAAPTSRACSPRRRPSPRTGWRTSGSRRSDAWCASGSRTSASRRFARGRGRYPIRRWPTRARRSPTRCASSSAIFAGTRSTQADAREQAAFDSAKRLAAGDPLGAPAGDHHRPRQRRLDRAGHRRRDRPARRGARRDGAPRAAALLADAPRRARGGREEPRRDERAAPGEGREASRNTGRPGARR